MNALTFQVNSKSMLYINFTSIKLVLSCSPRNKEEWSKYLHLRIPQQTGVGRTQAIGEDDGQPQILSWGCKKGCWGIANTKKVSLKCTALCQCGGDCEGDGEELV